jgi:DNA-binding beta-propeller fold protein YncE
MLLGITAVIAGSIMPTVANGSVSGRSHPPPILRLGLRKASDAGWVSTGSRYLPGGLSLSAARAGSAGLQSADVGCSSAVAGASPIASARTAFLQVPHPPFGVAATRVGHWAFADEIDSKLIVLRDGSLEPRIVRSIRLPYGAALGMTLAPDGRYLLIADVMNGVWVVSVTRAERGERSPVLGTLFEPGQIYKGGGAIEVATSRDGQYVFVSLEDRNQVAVYDLREALADHFRGSGYLGVIPLGIAPVGLAVSPNGRWLYASSEASRPGSQGTLSVIDVAAAERSPKHAVRASVPAGCSPVRVALSPDGRIAWVTARGSDALLAFSTRALIRHAHALLAVIPVGEAPVGLAVVAHGAMIVVGNSDRFHVAGAGADLMVVSAKAALAHQPAVLGTLPSGIFPRDMALEPDGDTLLVVNYTYPWRLEAISIKSLARQYA